MTGSILHQGIWILVSDGRKALFLQNEGDHVYPKLVTREVREHSDEPSHMLGSDVPGRTVTGKDGRHAAFEPQDLQAQEENKFLRSVAEDIMRRVSNGEIGTLVVVAPPRALATLRKAQTQATHKIIWAEIDKDFVNLPLYEIEKHLAARE